MMTDNNNFQYQVSSSAEAPQQQQQQQVNQITVAVTNNVQQQQQPQSPLQVVPQISQQQYSTISSGYQQQINNIQQQQQQQQQLIIKEELNLDQNEQIKVEEFQQQQQQQQFVVSGGNILAEVKPEIKNEVKVDSKPENVEPNVTIYPPPKPGEQPFMVARLSYQNDILYLTKTGCIDIGRNSSTSKVHFNVGKNSFISRKHFQIFHDANNNEFYIIVCSKNGIFIDDVFNRKTGDPELLPRICSFRFPSTHIRIAFDSYMEDERKGNKPKIDQQQSNASSFYTPLKIKIPKSEKKSPQLSPTGTLSAANSCPTSPRQSFRDYHSAYPNNYPSNNNGYGVANVSASSSGQNVVDLPAPSTSYNEHEKPLYSYAQLIVQSISASPEKQLTLSGIYSFITKHYPYYRKEANKGWQNSIRHNLSLNRYFIKVERSQDEPGKGSFWRIDPVSEGKLIDQSYRKRRQRGSQCFRTPYGMPRSAPASPNHIDNSRENSPLHDIILQSAPGSPENSYHNNSANNSQPQQQQQQRNGNVSSGSVGGGNVGVLPIWPE